MLLNFLLNGLSPTALIIGAIVMIMALIFHNIVQAWLAARYGDNTPRMQGFMNFDPQQQLEPMGVLFLFLLGFGWPKAVPVNSRNYPGRGRQEALVWYSGPLAFVLVAFVSLLVGRIFLALGNSELYLAFLYAGLVAVRHAVINLFPVFPLDGARAALAWGNIEVRRLVQQIASYGLIGFIVIFLLLSYTGILGAIEQLIVGLINTVLGIIPGL